MRKALVLVVLCFSVSTALLAQQTKTFSVFLPELRSSASTVNPWPGGVGVSLDWMFSPRLSVQGSIGYERHRTYPYVVETDGSITLVARQNLRTIPLELSGRFHWPNDSRWKPYLGLGVHYVAAPNADPRFRYQDKLDAVFTGGTLFMLTPSLGVMIEGRSLIGDREPYDPMSRVSAGVSWRF